MKKCVCLFLLGFNLVCAQQKENPISPFLWNRISEYKPLEESSLSSFGFLDSLFIQKGDCDGLWEYYQRVSCYPSDGLEKKDITYSSLISPPINVSKNNSWGSSLAKMIANSITDSLYVNEYYPEEIRFESCLPKNQNLTKNEYSKQLQLHSFVPENNRLHGLLSDPIDILHGARLEIIYNILNNRKEPIFIDNTQPLIYEIRSVEDSVTHTFSFKLRDAQFNDIFVAFTEINILPPVDYDYMQITKDSIGKAIFWGNDPVWISTFEKGMLHFIYDEGNPFKVKQVLAVKNGTFAVLKPEMATFPYLTYDYCRKNPGLTRDELCKLYDAPENMRKIQLEHRVGGAMNYGVFVACLGSDADEIYLSKERDISYNEILGSRVIMFSMDSLSNSYHYSLLKKGEDGVLRMLHEDTTRTPPRYEGLDEEISKNLEYPKAAADSGSEAVVLIAAMVHTDGTMTDVRLFSDPWDHLLDEEALRAVKLLKNKWIPAALDGEPVDMQVIIPVRFSTKP
ncbi:MAG: energy transducer TonB [Tannerella sp.]|jgi:TonB family protein|nr:energy transducer TonB [Tannerella sp.]